VFLVRQFLLLHTSGEERVLSTSWPVVPDKGRPLDKATASAATTSLAYLLRDLLLAPRVDPSDDLAGREDRPVLPAKKAKPREPGEQIGHEGAQKLLQLAERKRVKLDAYLEPHGAKFTPLAEITRAVARIVYGQLVALPDPPAVMPTPPATVTAPPQASANGQAKSSTNNPPPAAPAAPPARKATCPF
jgi:hypothetical protein